MNAIRLPTCSATFKPNVKEDISNSFEKKYKLTEELIGRTSDTP
jgi:hypothetical protein